jgi:hypothetical protein
MNRKAFIQSFGLMGVGLALAPIRLFGARPTMKSYQLPKPTVHILHGNFAANELEKLTIPEVGLECTVQQFMRNGISESADDLTVYSFRSGNELLNVSFTRSGKEFSNGKISGLQLKFDISEITAEFKGRHSVLLKV